MDINSGLDEVMLLWSVEYNRPQDKQLHNTLLNAIFPANVTLAHSGTSSWTAVLFFSMGKSSTWSCCKLLIVAVSWSLLCYSVHGAQNSWLHPCMIIIRRCAARNSGSKEDMTVGPHVTHLRT